MNDDIKKLHELYNLLFKFPAELRLAFALTVLDEATEVLNVTPEQIQNLRDWVHEELGDYYG